jgi:hypothetical protein
MLGTYACWGELERVVTAKAAKPAVRPQDAAAKKLAEAQKMVALTTRRIARLTTALRRWQNKATYYAKRASMTDEELAAERQREKEKEEARAARRQRRAIALEGQL